MCFHYIRTMETFGNDKFSKILHKFNCEKCNYGCSKKGDFNKHIRSAKHNAETVGNDYSCSNCAKNFKTRSGLWKHKKSCTYTPPPSHEENIQATIEHVEPTSTELLVLVKELMKQNQELQNTMKEMIPHIGNNNNTNTTNVNGPTFNVQFFVRISSVRNKLTDKYFFVRVEGMDDDL